jgi:hypothetical protein
MAVSKRQIFAHRGMWLDSGLKKNSIGAFQLAFESGFGVEVDVRDYLGKIVISHDPPTERGVEFEDLVDIASGFPDLPMAINVKSDGLGLSLSKYEIRNPHFFFDMSVPEERSFIQQGLAVASRVSEYESVDRDLHPNLWVDAFTSDWYINEPRLMEVITNSPRAVFVSPELHGRSHMKTWEVLAPLMAEAPHLGVCTDFPLEFMVKWAAR